MLCNTLFLRFSGIPFRQQQIPTPVPTMCASWKGLLLLGLGVFAEAFVSRPLRLQPSASGAARTPYVSGAAATARGTATRTIMQEASTAGAGATASKPLSSAGVEVGEISGKRLFVEFAAFGFFKRNCQLELKANGDSVISKGMVTPENGAWRIEAEEGAEYLQFSCPLTELYSEIFEIPSSLLFWRVPLRKGQDGSIVLEGGQIISERKELFGLKTSFIDEGTFKARVLADDEEFPAEDVVDISKIPVPEGLKKRKRKIKEKPSLEEEVAEPPLPSDLQA